MKKNLKLKKLKMIGNLQILLLHLNLFQRLEKLLRKMLLSQKRHLHISQQESLMSEKLHIQNQRILIKKQTINLLTLKTKILFGLKIKVIIFSKEMISIQLWMPIQSPLSMTKNFWWQDWTELPLSSRW
jgi:hypothetical protein